MFYDLFASQSVSIVRCYHLWAHLRGSCENRQEELRGLQTWGGSIRREAETKGKEGAWAPIQTRGPDFLILHLLFFLCTFLYCGSKSKEASDCLV